jgi:hypothetical protein
MALASLSLLWIGAITVAWCVSTTHSSRVDARVEVKTTPASIAATDEVRRLFERAGFEVVHVYVAPKSKRAFVYLWAPDAASAAALGSREGPLHVLSDEARPLLASAGMPDLTVVPLDPARPAQDGEAKNAAPWGSKARILRDGSIVPVAAPPGKTAPNVTSAR